MFEDEKLECLIKIEKAGENAHCIHAVKVVGEKMDFLETFTRLRDLLSENEGIIV